MKKVSIIALQLLIYNKNRCLQQRRADSDLQPGPWMISDNEMIIEDEIIIRKMKRSCGALSLNYCQKSWTNDEDRSNF